MPYREIGIVKQASKEFIMNIEEASSNEEGVTRKDIRFKVLATSKQEVRIVLQNKKGGEYYNKVLALSPEEVFEQTVDVKDATMNDLAQIVYEALLKTDEKRIIEIYEQGETSINCYCCAIIRNQYFSDSSRFYYDYKSVMLYEEVKGTGYNGQDGRCEDDFPAGESGI
jgi:hypothetical protein